MENIKKFSSWKTNMSYTKYQGGGSKAVIYYMAKEFVICIREHESCSVRHTTFELYNYNEFLSCVRHIEMCIPKRICSRQKDQYNANEMKTESNKHNLTQHTAKASGNREIFLKIKNIK